MPSLRLTTDASTQVRTWLACLSFVNLSFVPMWAKHPTEYLEPLPYGALFLTVLALGTTLFIMMFVVGRHGALRDSWLTFAVALALFVVFPLDGMRIGLGLSAKGLATTVGSSGALPIGFLLLLGAALAVMLCLRHRQRIITVGTGFLLIMSPLLVFSGILAATRGGFSTVAYSHYENSGIRSAAGIDATGRPRIYFLIFDEADYALMFDQRAPGLGLPVLDSLAGASVFFTRAYAPANNTLLSVPSMLMGTPLSRVQSNGRALAAWTDSKQYYPDWLAADHLLRSMSARGPVAALGYYHPYCDDPRLQLAYCSHWRVFPWHGWAFQMLPLPLAALQDSFLFRHALSPYLPAAVERARVEHPETFAAMTAELDHLVDRYALVYAHLNLPHPVPLPVQAVKKKMGKLSRDAYNTNLRLVDSYLGRLLPLLRTGVSEGRDAVLIVTADHGLRIGSWSHFGYDVTDFADMLHDEKRSDLHVPLLVHFVRSAQAIRVDAPAANIHVGALIQAIAAGEVQNETQAAAFISGRPVRLRTQDSPEHQGF